MPLCLIESSCVLQSLRPFPLIVSFVLATGCASVFDAPYIDLSASLDAPEIVGEAVVEVVPPELDPAMLPAVVEKQHYDDLWLRLKAGLNVPEMDRDPKVLQAARRFAQDRYLERTSARGADYLFYVVEEVDRRQLPMELALVPFVESGYTLEAKSQAEAHGAWQFIEKTGRTYELDIDRFRDERRSLIASTRAALDYLSDLYRMFGSWPLAMAAYNCGEKRIQAEIDRARARGVKQPGFNDLAAVLPVETREYVPRILALRRLIANPAEYRLSLPAIRNEPRHSVVEIRRDIDLDLVIRLSGLSPAAFSALNPSIKAPVILGGYKTQLLLPHDAALRLSLGMGTYAGPWVSWRAIRITRPASPSEIARRNSVPLKRLLFANPLPDGQLYMPGSTLLIPLKSHELGTADVLSGGVQGPVAMGQCGAEPCVMSRTGTSVPRLAN